MHPILRLCDRAGPRSDAAESASFLQSEPALFHKSPCGGIAAALEEKNSIFAPADTSSANRRVDLRRKPGIVNRPRHGGFEERTASHLLPLANALTAVV